MISLIAAVAQNRALGKDGQLLWHLPEDMRYFRETTRGKPVIMGIRPEDIYDARYDSMADFPRKLGRRNML